MKPVDRPPVRLSEYRPPAWWVDRVELDFDLDFDRTRVRARLEVRRNAQLPHAPLRLDGEGLELHAVSVDGAALAPGDYVDDGRALTLSIEGDRAVIETVVSVAPRANTELSGLYASGAFLLTQCEAEGFRRITFFPDRPDVMARFAVTLRGDRERFPVLLSNGNPAGHGTQPDGTHWARWEDPWPKPCYLFALVAGRLERIEDHFVTAEGREVLLTIWADAAAIGRCDHAMASLKAAMRWDEQAYGRCYDLDVYHIVATQDFNMGAMENKGLNVFNAKFIVADVDTATDDDFLHVAGVVAHEYFHNWTGNRITCRDWFQLSLKEGLTVFRDQQFSADQGSPALRRIEDVRVLRSVQFAEDAGPFAHPVRPDSYQAIDNFYTATVYEKGAEIIRMMHTVLGPEAFRRGMDLYFERHDGQAATCEDFRAALADGSGVDLSPFARWYTQAGTPVLEASVQHEADARRLMLRLGQHTPPTPGQPEKAPVPIPVRLMAYRPDGTPLALRLEGETEAREQRVLLLTGERRDFVFEGVDETPVFSLLQGFSAPVRRAQPPALDELRFLARHDRDPFNRFEAFQGLAQGAILGALQGDPAASAHREGLIEASAALLEGALIDDPGLVAECLVPPEEAYLAEQLAQHDPVALHAARESLRAALGRALAARLSALHDTLSVDDALRRDGAAIARRRLRNVALSLLMRADPLAHGALAQAQLAAARNMTDRIAALAAMVHHEVPGATRELEAFLVRWRDDPLVLDKWFALQAADPRPGALARVRALTAHPAFAWRNPNKVRALIGTFTRGNRANFHAEDGAAYGFVAEAVLNVDALNPQVAARLATAFNGWRRVDAARSLRMREALETIAASPALSADTREIVGRALA